MLSSNAAEPDIVIRPIPGALAMAVPPSPKLSNGRLTPSHTWPGRTILPSLAVMNRRLSAPSKISGRSARLVDTRQRRQGSRRQPELQGNDCGTPAGWNPQEIREYSICRSAMGCTGPPCGSSPRRPQKAHIANITGLHRFGDGSDRILDRHVRIDPRNRRIGDIF